MFFMKLRLRTLHFWSVFVFPTNHMVFPSLNSRQHDDIRHKNPAFWSWFWLAFLVSFWGSFIGFTDGNIMWLVVNTKTLQKWRVCGLSFIKHQKVLKNSTWAWSYVDLKKGPFFFTQNRTISCWPKIWQWCISTFELAAQNALYGPLKGIYGKE